MERLDGNEVGFARLLGLANFLIRLDKNSVATATCFPYVVVHCPVVTCVSTSCLSCWTSRSISRNGMGFPIPRSPVLTICCPPSSGSIDAHLNRWDHDKTPTTLSSIPGSTNCLESCHFIDTKHQGDEQLALLSIGLLPVISKPRILLV